MKSEIEAIETTIDEVKEKIELMKMLDTLHRSPAFKKIILKKYIQEKPQELVSLTAMPQNEMQKELIMNSMIGISALQRFFSEIYRDGRAAEEGLAEHEQYLAEVASNV